MTTNDNHGTTSSQTSKTLVSSSKIATTPIQQRSKPFVSSQSINRFSNMQNIFSTVKKSKNDKTESKIQRTHSVNERDTDNTNKSNFKSNSPPPPKHTPPTKVKKLAPVIESEDENDIQRQEIQRQLKFHDPSPSPSMTGTNTSDDDRAKDILASLEPRQKWSTGTTTTDILETINDEEKRHHLNDNDPVFQFTTKKKQGVFIDYTTTWDNVTRMCNNHKVTVLGGIPLPEYLSLARTISLDPVTNEHAKGLLQYHKFYNIRINGKAFEASFWSSKYNALTLEVTLNDDFMYNTDVHPYLWTILQGKSLPWAFKPNKFKFTKKNHLDITSLTHLDLGNKTEVTRLWKSLCNTEILTHYYQDLKNDLSKLQTFSGIIKSNKQKDFFNPSVGPFWAFLHIIFHTKWYQVYHTSRSQDRYNYKQYQNVINLVHSYSMVTTNLIKMVHFYDRLYRKLAEAKGSEGVDILTRDVLDELVCYLTENIRLKSICTVISNKKDQTGNVTLLKDKIHQQKDQLQTLNDQLNIYRNQLQEIKRQRSKLNETLNKHTSSGGTTNSNTTSSKLLEENQRLKLALQQHDEQSIIEKTRYKNLESSYTILKQDFSSKSKQNQNLESKLTTQRKYYENLLAKMSERKDYYKDKYTEEVRRHTQTRKDSQQQDLTINSWKNKYRELTFKCNNISQENLNHQKHIESLDSQVETLNEDKLNLSENLQRQTDDNKKLQNFYETASVELDTLKVTHQNLLNKYTKLLDKHNDSLINVEDDLTDDPKMLKRALQQIMADAKAMNDDLNRLQNEYDQKVVENTNLYRQIKELRNFIKQDDQKDLEKTYAKSKVFQPLSHDVYTKSTDELIELLEDYNIKLDSQRTEIKHMDRYILELQANVEQNFLLAISYFYYIHHLKGSKWKPNFVSLAQIQTYVSQAKYKKHHILKYFNQKNPLPRKLRAIYHYSLKKHYMKHLDPWDVIITLDYNVDPDITLYIRRYSEDSAYTSAEDFPVTKHVSYLLNYDPDRIDHQLDNENTWVRNTHEISGELEFEESPIEPKVLESQPTSSKIPIYPSNKESLPFQQSPQPKFQPSVLPKSHYPKSNKSSKSSKKSTKSNKKSKNPSSSKSTKSTKSTKFSSKSKSKSKKLVSTHKFSKVKPTLDVSDSIGEDSNETISSSSDSQPISITTRYYSKSQTSKKDTPERKHDSTSQSETDDDDDSSDLLSQMPTLKGQYPRRKLTDDFLYLYNGTDYVEHDFGLSDQQISQFRPTKIQPTTILARRLDVYHCEFDLDQLKHICSTYDIQLEEPDSIYLPLIEDLYPPKTHTSHIGSYPVSVLSHDFFTYQRAKDIEGEQLKAIRNEATLKPFGIGHFWYDRGYYFLGYIAKVFNALNVEAYWWPIWAREWFKGDKELLWFDRNKHLWATSSGSPGARWNAFVKAFVYRYVPKNVPQILMEWFIAQPLLNYDVEIYLERYVNAWKILVFLDRLVFSRVPNYFNPYTMITVGVARKNMITTINDIHLGKHFRKHKAHYRHEGPTVETYADCIRGYYDTKLEKERKYLKSKEARLHYDFSIRLRKRVQKHQGLQFAGPKLYDYGKNFDYPAFKHRHQWKLSSLQYEAFAKLPYPLNTSKKHIKVRTQPPPSLHVNVVHHNSKPQYYPKKPPYQPSYIRQPYYSRRNRYNFVGYRRKSNYKRNGRPNRSYYQPRNQPSRLQLSRNHSKSQNPHNNSQNHKPRGPGKIDNRTGLCQNCKGNHLTHKCPRFQPRVNVALIEVNIPPEEDFTDDENPFKGKSCDNCFGRNHVLTGCNQDRESTTHIAVDKMFDPHINRQHLHKYNKHSHLVHTYNTELQSALPTYTNPIGPTECPQRDINGIALTQEEINQNDKNIVFENGMTLTETLTKATPDDLLQNLEETVDTNLHFVRWLSKLLYYIQYSLYSSASACIPLFFLFLTLLYLMLPWISLFLTSVPFVSLILLCTFILLFILFAKYIPPYKFVLILIFLLTLICQHSSNANNSSTLTSIHSFESHSVTTVRTVDTLAYVDWNKIETAATDEIHIANAGIDAVFKLDSGSDVNLVNNMMWRKLLHLKREGRIRYIIHTAGGQNFIQHYLYLKLVSRSGDTFYTKFFFSPSLDSQHPFILAKSVCKLLGYTISSEPSFPLHNVYSEDVTVSDTEFERYDFFNRITYDPEWHGKQLNQITFDLIDNETMFINPLVRNTVRLLLRKFWRVCGTDNRYNIAQFKGYQLNFTLKPGATIQPQPIYSLSREAQQNINAQVKQLLASNMIRQVFTPSAFAFPTFLVWKKLPSGPLPPNYQREGRMCHNYSALNDIIEPIQEHCPDLWQSVQSLAGHRYVSSYDIRNAYSHIALHPDIRPYVRFSTPNGNIYEWNVANFGLRDLPGIWNSLMRQVYKDPKYVVYFDDISHPSNTIEEWAKDFENFLKRTHDHNLTIRIAKCKFCVESIDVLGYCINCGAIEPTSQQRKTVIEIPMPKDKATLKRYLGTLSYSSKFFHNFGHLTEPFFDILRKKVNFRNAWTKEIRKDWQHLTKAFSTICVLEAPVWDQPFCLAVDASDYASGAAVFQIIDGKFRFIELGYKIFSQLQKHGWHSTEKEVWSVAYFLDKYERYFVNGPHYNHIFSDAEILKKLFSKKQVNSKLMRYRYRIGNYKVRIHHLKGDLNSLADFLSRDLHTVKQISNATLNPPIYIQYGPEFGTIYNKCRLTTEDNVSPITIPSDCNLAVDYQVNPTIPLCPHCHDDMHYTRIYDTHGILSTSCATCYKHIKAPVKVWNCVNHAKHTQIYALCPTCVMQHTQTLDDVDWHIHQSVTKSSLPSRPLFKHFKHNLTYAIGLNSHSVTSNAPMDIHIETHVVETKSDSESSSEFPEADFPETFDCFHPQCKHQMLLDKCVEAYPKGSTCDECNVDIQPSYYMYHCANPFHDDDDNPAINGYSICLQCAFKRTDKSVPEKYRYPGKVDKVPSPIPSASPPPPSILQPPPTEFSVPSVKPPKPPESPPVTFDIGFSKTGPNIPPRQPIVSKPKPPPISYSPIRKPEPPKSVPTKSDVPNLPNPQPEIPKFDSPKPELPISESSQLEPPPSPKSPTKPSPPLEFPKLPSPPPLPPLPLPNKPLQPHDINLPSPDPPDIVLQDDASIPSVHEIPTKPVELPTTPPPPPTVSNIPTDLIIQPPQTAILPSKSPLVLSPHETPQHSDEDESKRHELSHPPSNIASSTSDDDNDDDDPPNDPDAVPVPHPPHPPPPEPDPVPQPDQLYQVPFYIDDVPDPPIEPPWNPSSNHFDQINIEVFQTHQDNCSLFGPIIQFLNGEIRPSALRKLHKRMMGSGTFRISRNNLLTWKSKSNNNVRLCVPENLQQQLMSNYHNHYIHLGIDKMRHKMRRKYYFPGMYKLIDEHVNKCITCQFTHHRVQPHPIRFSTIKPSHPNEVLGMDFIGPMPNVGPNDEQYVLTIVDYYDNWVRYIPLATNTGYATFKALLEHWILLEGIPETIVCDRGSHFANALQQVNASIWNYKIKFVTAYNPRAAGLVERFNRTFRSKMRTICFDKHYELDEFPWWNYCSWAAYISNMTICNKTGFPPWQMRRVNPIIDLPHLLHNLDTALARQQFHHTDFYQYLDIQHAALKTVKKVAKQNWSKYIQQKAHVYWKKLTKRQRKQLQKKPIKIGSKVMVQEGSKSGISPNKLQTRVTGPWTVLGVAVNNNAYKVRNDQSDHIEYIGLRRIKLIKPTEIASTGALRRHQQTN